MDIKEFTEKFKLVFDEPQLIELLPDSYFKELEAYSSMTTLAIIAFADENFDVELSGKEIKDVETVKDLYDLINSKLS